MRHFVAYHSVKKTGVELGWEPGQKKFAFWSRRPISYLSQTEGNTVWAIEGKLEGKITIYQLWGYYTVSKIKDSGDGYFHVPGTRGIVFDAPIQLNSYDWFPALLNEQGRFAFGVNETKIDDAIADLMHFASNPPKKSQTDVEQKSRSNAQSKLTTTTRILIPEEIGDDEEILTEGAVAFTAVNAYERNARGRQRCIEHYGLDCFICGFNFKQVYGDEGEGTIHVHHLKPLSEIKQSYKVDPIKDLRPICPNCHAMIHSKYPMYTVAEVEKMLGRKKHSSKN